jgi:hypothetical protein
MAGRSRDTYKKRQKEVARAEKQKEKVARRQERKLNPGVETGEPTQENLAGLFGGPDDYSLALPGEGSAKAATAHESAPPRSDHSGVAKSSV